MEANILFKTLIIKCSNYRNSYQAKRYSFMIDILKDHFPDNIVISTSLNKLFIQITKSKKRNLIYILKNIFLMPYKIITNTKETFYCHNKYFHRN